MTESADNYLCFHMGTAFCIVPVMEVERICLPEDALQDGELVWIGFEEQEPEAGGAGEQECVVILREEDGRYGIRSDGVEGVLQIDPSEQYEIPEEISSRYPWLLGAAVRKEEGRLLLLLDGRRLGLLSYQAREKKT